MAEFAICVIDEEFSFKPFPEVFHSVFQYLSVFKIGVLQKSCADLKSKKEQQYGGERFCFIRTIYYSLLYTSTVLPYIEICV